MAVVVKWTKYEKHLFVHVPPQNEQKRFKKMTLELSQTHKELELRVE